jgi:hypothetical protein
MEGDRVWHGRCDVAGRGGLGVGVGGGRGSKTGEAVVRGLAGGHCFGPA